MTEGWLNARAGWTTQGSRILLSTTTLTPDPVPGTRYPGHGVTISAARAHTNSDRRIKSLAAQPQSKDLQSPTSLTRRRRKTKELFPRGYKNDADRRACHAAPNSWKTDKVYAGETPADQESGRAREEPGGDRRVDRRDGWFSASHLFKVRDKSAASCF